jgi:hypothetical protein
MPLGLLPAPRRASTGRVSIQADRQDVPRRGRVGLTAGCRGSVPRRRQGWCR